MQFLLIRLVHSLFDDVVKNSVIRKKKKKGINVTSLTSTKFLSNKAYTPTSYNNKKIAFNSYVKN